MTFTTPKQLRALQLYVMKRMRVSIRLTVIAFFLFATLATATVAISLQYVFSRNLAVDTTLSAFKNAAISTERYIDGFNEDALSIVRVLSHYTHIKNQQTLSKESRSFFTEIMNRNPLIHGIYVGFNKGNYIEIVNLDADKSTRETLKAQASDRWVLINITGKGKKRQRVMTFVDKNFKARTTQREYTSFSPSTRPWFTHAKAGEVYTTKPYLFEQSQSPGKTFSIKLPNDDAVLGLDVTTSSVADYLTSIEMPLDANIYLFNERGELSASNQQKEAFTSLPPAPVMSLTAAQKKLVTETPYLMVANEMDWPPISFAASGQPYGYAVDVLDYISQMTGIKIRYVNGMSWKQLGNMFMDRKLQVLQPVFYDPSRLLIGNLSDPFLHVPYGVLTAKGAKAIHSVEELKGKAVAIPEGRLLAANLKEWLPEIKILTVPNVKGMFDAVRDGRADAAIDTTAMLSYTANQFFINDVTINSPLEFGKLKIPETLHFLLPRNNAQLTSLFNLALAKIESDYKQALNDKWLNQESEKDYQRGVVPYKALIKIAQQGGSEGLVKVELGGVDYYVYVAPIVSDNNDKNFLAIITPERVLMAASLEKVIDAILITTLILTLLLPIAWFLSRPFVRPIRQLAADSKNIAHRRYDKVGSVTSRIAEVHDLAISMNDMSESIQRHEQEQQALLDSFIKLIAQAIDDKSHHTAGHCERVPQLALILAKHANQTDSGVFESFSFDDADQWREFEVGAWLHDCGKITTPEYIIDKGTKLEANYNRIHEIRMRFEVLWRDSEINYLTQCVEPNANVEQLFAEKEQQQQQLQDDFAFIANANIGGEFMSEEDLERLQQLSKVGWQRYFDDRLGLSHIELKRYSQDEQALPVEEALLANKQSHRIKRERDVEFAPELAIKMDVPEDLYNQGELYNLSVRAGTLVTEDRFKINEHIISTIKMLDTLPFPPELSKVPRYASTHHETMDGRGYPRKLSAEDLSIPERIMVVADVYEALTAADRLYKKAKTMSESLNILQKMVDQNHIDYDIFELFLTSGAYLEYAKKFLQEEQIDDVDIQQYLRK